MISWGKRRTKEKNLFHRRGKLITFSLRTISLSAPYRDTNLPMEKKERSQREGINGETCKNFSENGVKLRRPPFIEGQP